MLLLIIISLAGLFFSALIHILVLLHVYDPPRELVILINLGGAFVIYMAIFITKRGIKGVRFAL